MRRAQFDLILNAMLGSCPGISDLIFATGRQPQVESDGELRPVQPHPLVGALTPYQTERIAMNIVGENPRLLRDLLTRGACDCAYSIEEKVRFRVNIFKQQGRFSVVMRRAQVEMPSLASLGLPPIFQEICRVKNGLILLTGATGTGKTTTLSAIIDEINSTQAVHIITLEDPIEFVHSQKRSTLSQRELGADFQDFAEGLRSAMRQAPKVILVGEIRDRDTVQIALSAAETGHLVLASLPTTTASQSVNRLLGMVEASEQTNLRIRLMECLRYVVAQRLVPKIGGGRQLVQEVVGMNMRVREVMAQGEGEGRSFYDITEANAAFGWMTFDQSLHQAFAAGLVEEETALLYATNRNRLTRLIDEEKKRQGQPHPSSNLRLDGVVPSPPSAPLPGFRLSA